MEKISGISEQPPASERRETFESPAEARWLREVFPVLREVDFALVDADYFEGGAGGQFLLPDQDNDLTRPRVLLTRGDAKHFVALKETRRASVEAIAEQLGIPFERVTGGLLRKQILFHEAGHAADFLEHFSGDDAFASLDESLMAWDDREDRELDELPIPGMHPGTLNEEIEGAGGFETWRNAFPEQDTRCVGLGVQTKEDLLRIQERAYRGLSKERYADTFAAQALKKYFTVQQRAA